MRTPTKFVQVVDNFFQNQENHVLHLDDMITKSRRVELEYVFDWLEREDAAARINVAFVQGAPLYKPHFFQRLLKLIRKGDVFSINLGEIQFSVNQLEDLIAAMKESNVTHMFAELEGHHNYHWKSQLRDAIRQNRKKHDLWRLKPDDKEHNQTIVAAQKNWFNPINHSVNHEFLDTYGGIGGLEDLRRNTEMRMRRELPWKEDRVKFQLKKDGPFERGIIVDLACIKTKEGIRTIKFDDGKEMSCFFSMENFLSQEEDLALVAEKVSRRERRQAAKEEAESQNKDQATMEVEAIQNKDQTIGAQKSKPAVADMEVVPLSASPDNTVSAGNLKDEIVDTGIVQGESVSGSPDLMTGAPPVPSQNCCASAAKAEGVQVESATVTNLESTPTDSNSANTDTAPTTEASQSTTENEIAPFYDGTNEDGVWVGFWVWDAPKKGDHISFRFGYEMKPGVVQRKNAKFEGWYMVKFDDGKLLEVEVKRNLLGETWHFEKAVVTNGNNDLNRLPRRLEDIQVRLDVDGSIQSAGVVGLGRFLFPKEVDMHPPAPHALPLRSPATQNRNPSNDSPRTAVKPGDMVYMSCFANPRHVVLGHMQTESTWTPVDNLESTTVFDLSDRQSLFALARSSTSSNASFWVSQLDLNRANEDLLKVINGTVETLARSPNVPADLVERLQQPLESGLACTLLPVDLKRTTVTLGLHPARLPQGGDTLVHRMFANFLGAVSAATTEPQSSPLVEFAKRVLVFQFKYHVGGVRDLEEPCAEQTERRPSTRVSRRRKPSNKTVFARDARSSAELSREMRQKEREDKQWFDLVLEDGQEVCMRLDMDTYKHKWCHVNEQFASKRAKAA